MCHYLTISTYGLNLLIEVIEQSLLQSKRDFTLSGDTVIAPETASREMTVLNFCFEKYRKFLEIIRVEISYSVNEILISSR